MASKDGSRRKNIKAEGSLLYQTVNLYGLNPGQNNSTGQGGSASGYDLRKTTLDDNRPSQSRMTQKESVIMENLLSE